MTIRIEGLTKRYKGVAVLSDISLTIESGCVTGLHGVNGSGKTMLMRAVCGLIAPTEGRILIDGTEMYAGATYPARLGMLIENPAFLAGYTGFENLKVLASIRGIMSDDDIRQALCDVGLDPSDTRKYRKYSLGMKQRLGIAAATMEEPDIVVLDEPTNALDELGVDMVKHVVDRLRARGATVLISCHDASVLTELSDVIVHLYEGRITGTERVEHAGEDQEVCHDAA